MAIGNEFIAKIEGHGSLSVDWDKNSVKLNVHEGERLFEGILVGRTAEEAHWITPRICGVCPIAHNLASLAAIEDAYGIEINKTSKLLRQLMVCAQMIQSHVLHLFFLALPDYAGIDRGTELAKKNPKAFAKALTLKEIADQIAYVAAGRNVHPTRTCVGGFHKIPTEKELAELLNKLQKTEGEAKWAAEFFSGLKYPELNVDLKMVALIDDKIVSKSGESVSIKEYKQTIEEELRDYSTAKFGTYKGKEMMVGALARLAVSPPGVGGFAAKLDFQNPFHNNFAQAIEILQYHIYAKELIDKLLDMQISKDDSSVFQGSPLEKGKEYCGIGAVEAPRGSLYHEIHLDENGAVVYANIITPTVQNLTSIEKSAKALLELHKDKKIKERERLLNMLVRAYDPCITCSVH